MRRASFVAGDRTTAARAHSAVRSRQWLTECAIVGTFRLKGLGLAHLATAGGQESLVRPLTLTLFWRETEYEVTSGRGAVWLARLNGVQKVASSNLVAPTTKAFRSNELRKAF